jgi:integrase
MLRGLPCCSRLTGWFGAITASPRSLAVPFADRRGPPDRLPADLAVGAGHLATGDIGADGGRRDIHEARDVACCPPVIWERLCHAARLQLSRCLIAAGAFRPDDGERHTALTRFGHHIGGAAVSAGGLMLRRGLSPSTVLKVHRILSRALRIAVRRGRITRNVAALIDAPSAARHEIEPLTREEARRILDVAARKRNGARWSVALALGIRQGEALGLRWSYVDLESGTIRAWFQIQCVQWRHGCDDPHACGELWHRRPCKPKCKRHRHLPDCEPGCTHKGHVCYKRSCPADCIGHADKCPKRIGGGVVFRQRKGKGKLTLHCPPALLELLREHRRKQAAERLRAGNSWTDHDLVFATRHGGPVAHTEDWRAWKAILRQAKVRDVRVHDARHTAATLLIEQGVHIRVVQEVLGHTRVTTTERYTHVATLQMKDASERMDQALWGQE